MSRLMRSSIALIVSTAATAVLGMAFWAVAAWVFAPIEVGRASAGAAAILLLAALGQLALTAVFARVLPTMTTSRLRRMITWSYALMTCASLAVTGIFVATGLGEGFLEPRPVPVLCFALAVVATAMSAVQDGAFVALSRASWVPVKNSILAVARMALLPLLALANTPAAILVAWTVPTVLAIVILNIVLYGRTIPAQAAAPTPAGDAPSRRGVLRLIGGQYAASIVNAITLFFPPVLVTLVLGPQANAVFFLPWTITTALIGLLWNIVVPFVVEASADPVRTRTHVRLTLRLGAVLTFGGTGALLILAPYLLAVAGSDYADGGTPALRLLALALPFTTIVSLFHAAELMDFKSSVSLWTKAVAAVLLLSAAIPGMHVLGVTGAAAAFLLSQAVVGLLLLRPVIIRYRILIAKAETPARVRGTGGLSLATAEDAVS
ncbi:lipopolysaccharide biosynthesis protein [Allorhizocola rhizosphaerae]|uniref:lipopolysaccharide biosynthesis protein n=1 Tax=Allorhizocola rhizosphaerae TaxID=1872709 RepID=UPI000E3BA8B9|nr:hypothetical protein [Allorhizocola rhizosphaerae]